MPSLGCLLFETSYRSGGGLQTSGVGTGSGNTFGAITVVVVGETLQVFFTSMFSISSRRNFRLLLFSDGLELRLRSGLEHGLEFELLSGDRLSTLIVPDCRPTIVRIKPYRFRFIHKSNALTFGRNEYRDFTSDADDIMLLRRNENEKALENMKSLLKFQGKSMVKCNLHQSCEIYALKQNKTKQCKTGFFVLEF